jgi:hypothetical protein
LATGHSRAATADPERFERFPFHGFPFTVSISGSASQWLQATPTTGAGPTLLNLTPVVSNLVAGTYSGTVTITPQLPAGLAQFGPGTVSFHVTISVGGATILNPGASLSQFYGAAPAPQTVSLTSNGTPAAFTLTVIPDTGGNWLSVTPSSGTTPASLTLTVNPTGISAGYYQSEFSIQGPINTVTFYVAWTFPPGTALSVSPTSLTFSLTPGQATPAQPQFLSFGPTVGLPPTAIISASTQSGGNWLSASVEGPSVQVNATAVNLGSGSYQGSVTITVASLNLVATAPVTLVVGPPPAPAQLSVTPSTLTLSAPVGAASTTVGNLTVSSTGGPGNFTIAASTGPFGFVVTAAASAPQYTTPAQSRYTRPLRCQELIRDRSP